MRDQLLFILSSVLALFLSSHHLFASTFVYFSIAPNGKDTAPPEQQGSKVAKVQHHGIEMSAIFDFIAVKVTGSRNVIRD